MSILAFIIIIIRHQLYLSGIIDLIGVIKHKNSCITSLFYQLWKRLFFQYICQCKSTQGYEDLSFERTLLVLLEFEPLTLLYKWEGTFEVRKNTFTVINGWMFGTGGGCSWVLSHTFGIYCGMQVTRTSFKMSNDIDRAQWCSLVRFVKLLNLCGESET